MKIVPKIPRDPNKGSEADGKDEMRQRNVPAAEQADCKQYEKSKREKTGCHRNASLAVMLTVYSKECPINGIMRWLLLLYLKN